MSIGIITFHAAHNYGAMLQAYALQTFIKDNIDSEVQIIDFRTKEDIMSYQIFKRPQKIRKYYREFIKLFYYRQLVKRYNSFEDFLKIYINTTHRYSSYQSLVNTPPEFDYYIAGSDQVFSPKRKEINAYYLSFGKKTTKKIAYAPSFGYKTIPPEKKEKITTLLKQFNHLSAREISGCEIIRELTGKEVTNVLDPVFLLNHQQYTTIAKPVKLKTKKYILCYALVGIKKQIPLALKLKEITGLPIILLKDSALFPVKGVDKIIRFAGPREFLWLFENASYVVTDSFHGTAFSLLFRKNFFTTIAFPEKAERIYSILSQTDLANRIVESPDEISINNLKIDYSHANKKLEEKVQLSKNFLLTSLQ